MIRIKTHRWPLTIVSCLAVCSLLLLLSGARSLREQRQTALRLPRATIEGAHEWALQNDSQCFGQLKTNLGLTEDYLTYSVSGSTELSINGKVSEVTVQGFIQLNSLDQIFASLFTITSNKKRWQFGSAGVLDMKWSIKQFHQDTDSILTKGVFKGPITISPSSADFYEVSHPSLDLGTLLSSQHAPAQLFRNVPIKLVEGSCSSKTPLALDPMIRAMQPLLNRAKIFLQ